jgi:hypothetical protein
LSFCAKPRIQACTRGSVAIARKKVAVTFKEKLNAALRLLDERGLTRFKSSGILHNLLWRLGLQVPPPLLARFLTNAAVVAVPLMVVGGALIHLMIWLGALLLTRRTNVSIFTVSVLAAIFLAFFYRNIARKHQIPL